jgi:hypothetical protein
MSSIGKKAEEDMEKIPWNDAGVLLKESIVKVLL